jgi:hypothetical protein
MDRSQAYGMRVLDHNRPSLEKLLLGRRRSGNEVLGIIQEYA